jgi:hypothetical protein
MAGAICLDMSITAERGSRYEALDRVPVVRLFSVSVHDGADDPADEERRSLIDEAGYRVRNEEPPVDVMSKRDAPGRAFEAGVSDAFPSGWSLQHVSKLHGELDGGYYLG